MGSRSNNASDNTNNASSDGKKNTKASSSNANNNGASNASTPLLPKDRKNDSHPIFLRVCHAPWDNLNQKSLASLRGLVAGYLLVSFLMVFYYDIKYNHHGWLAFFELPNISYGLQVIYSLIAFIWTFMHLYYPHHGSQAPSHATRLQKFWSPPTQRPSTKNRAFFSIFYTAAVTYPFVVVFIHWALQFPNHETAIPADQMLHGWFRTFFIVNKYGLNAFLAFVELFFFSSIRRQTPFGAHVVGLMFLSLVYIGWASLGHLLTGKIEYFLFDHNKVHHGEYIVAAGVGFLALTIVFFVFVYGLTGIREALVKKCNDKKGYQRLPQ